MTKTPPATLTGDTARERWKQTIADLGSEGRKLPRSNAGALEAYCSAFQLLSDCEKAIAADGLLIDGGRDGKRRHPALAGKTAALASIRSLAAQLGLTPTSAKPLCLPPVEREPNPFDALR